MRPFAPLSSLRSMRVPVLVLALAGSATHTWSQETPPQPPKTGTAANPGAALSTPRWWVINDKGGYRLDDGSGGDVLSSTGADVRVRREQEIGEGFGGSGLMLDARSYLGKQIVLSATLEAGTTARDGAIWLRADDATGKPVAFMNSQASPVSTGAVPALREVRITVPDSAVKLALGTFMRGTGTLHARNLRLEVRTPMPGDGKGAALLNETAALIKAHALYNRSLDWSAIEPELQRVAADLRDGNDAHAPIRGLLHQLKDRHSRLIPASQVREEGARESATRIEVKALPGEIGYIQVPGFGSADPEQARVFAHTAANAIADASRIVRKGWVVDLRKDSGGNMYPMIAALSALLGDQPLGYFEDRDGKRTPWRIDPGLKLQTSVDLRDAHVAVLIGPGTASSGEATALAFRGRASTRFFGQPSAGLSTGNQVFQLEDGSLLVLTGALMLDRNGRGDGERLVPDESTAEAADGQDPTLDAAIRWLSSRH